MAKKKNTSGQDRANRVIAENRRARHDYFISDTLEVGIVLRGSEIKTVKDGHVSIAEGYVRAEENPPCLFLHQVNIDEYGPAGPQGGAGQHRTTRVRTLLAHKREIRKLATAVSVKGMTIVPLRLYLKDNMAKLLIGVAQGKAAHDKRQAIGEREAKRDIARAMSRRRG